MHAATIPRGAKAIAALYFAGAAFMLLFGIGLMMSLGFIVAAMQSLLSFAPEEQATLTLFGILGAIPLFGLTAALYYIGRSLWRGKRLAWALAIITSYVAILAGMIAVFGGSLAGGAITVAINLAIVLYLIFDQSVKNSYA